jgi:tetratricopeptide (TPR) repeat protein
MMGDTPKMDYLLRQVMQRIERSRRRQKPLRRAIQFLDKNPEYRIYTSTQGYQPLKQAARYWFMLALIWRLLDDDRSADDKLKKARACRDRTPALEAEVLYEHITLLVRYGWRIDAVPHFFERIVALYKHERELELSARALTNWGKFLYGQKKYDEAHAKLIDAEEQWTTVQEQLGHIMSRAEVQGMMDTNWLLLKTLVAQKADRATINRVAQKTIRYDRNIHRKAAAATTLRRITNKVNNG